MEGAFLSEKSFRPYDSQRETGRDKRKTLPQEIALVIAGQRINAVSRLLFLPPTTTTFSSHPRVVVRFGIYRLISPAIAVATVREIVATCSLKYCEHRENHDTLMEARERSISYVFQSRVDIFENIYRVSRCVQVTRGDP